MAIIPWTGETDGVFGTNTNWVGDAVPGTGDVAFLPATATVDIDGDAATEAVIDRLVIEDGCTINIGSRTDGVITYLKLTFATETNAAAQIAGTGTMYLHLTEAKSVDVTNAGAAPGVGQFKTNLVTASASNDSDITIACEAGDSIGIGANPGEAAESEDIRIIGGDVTIGNAVTRIDGSTALELLIAGGDVVCHSAIANITGTGGTLRQEKGAITNGTWFGGTLYYNTTDTLAEIDVGRGGHLTFDEDPRAKIVAVCKIRQGYNITDSHNVVTWTNGRAPQEGMRSQGS